MLVLSNTVVLPDSEIELKAIRSQGSGGQRVNKVATAIHLRFDIRSSSLPDFYKERLLNTADSRISQDGIVVIKSQSFRTQEQNKEQALERLKDLILDVTRMKKPRKPTKPSWSAKRKRTDKKVKRGQTKKLRSRVDY